MEGKIVWSLRPGTRGRAGGVRTGRLGTCPRCGGGQRRTSLRGNRGGVL